MTLDGAQNYIRKALPPSALPYWRNLPKWKKAYFANNLIREPETITQILAVICDDADDQKENPA